MDPKIKPQLLGAIGFAGPVNGGTTIANRTGTPAFKDDRGRVHTIAVRAADQAGRSDGSANNNDSFGRPPPTLKPGDSVVIGYTVGFTDNASGVPTQGWGETYGLVAEGRSGALGAIPGALPDGHVMYAYTMFRNNGSTDFTYGTTNFAASSASGIGHRTVACLETPTDAEWDRVD